MDALPAFTSDRQILSEHLVDVCKYRQGPECCRYIYFPRDKKEFYCVKKITEMREKLDEEVENMIAKGDNCSGLPNEES